MARFDRIKLVEKNYKKLRNKTVAVVGCGSLGSRSSELLARWGLNFVLIDFDKIEESNLDSQIYFEKDVGKYKANVLKSRIKAINSEVKVKVFKKKLDKQNALKLLEGIDLIVDGTDNIETRRIINRACKQLKIPWVFAGVEKNRGIVTCFGKRYEFEKIIKKTITKKPFGISPQTTAIAAGLQAELAIKLLLNKKFEKKIFFFDLKRISFESLGNAYF